MEFSSRAQDSGDEESVPGMLIVVLMSGARHSRGVNNSKGRELYIYAEWRRQAVEDS